MPASENKEIVRRYWEGRFNEKDYSMVDQFLSPSAQPAGPGEQKAWLDAYHAACGDTLLTLNQLIADDDLVAVHYTFEGTAEGEWLGIAPTGKRVRTSGIALCRLANGKIVEDEGQLPRSFRSGTGLGDTRRPRAEPAEAKTVLARTSTWPNHFPFWLGIWTRILGSALRPRLPAGLAATTRR